MLDSLLTHTTKREYTLSSIDLNLKSTNSAEEVGGYDDFQRILDNAEAARQEHQRESIRKEEDEEADRQKSQELEALKDELTVAEENPIRFGPERTGGRSLTYETLEAEMSLPGGLEEGMSSLEVTEEALNSLGEFLLGLGLSSETVKAVSSEMEIGAIIQVKTLKEIISSTGALSLQNLLGEGDLNLFTLTLDSMGASSTDMGNLSLLLEENKGTVSLGTLLDFLKNLEKPQTQVKLTQLSENIKDLSIKLESAQEAVKAPVLNDILLKLSLLGDRELDKNFFELSPALQALKGGVSGIRADSQGGGDFNNPSGHNSEERKEREERRLMNAQVSDSSSSKAVSGAFTSSLYDEVASYSSTDTLAKQIKDKLIYSARRGIRRLKMNLSPEELGELSIELKVVGNKLTANIQADSMEAYKALEKEVMALRESLSAEGIELKLTLGYAGDTDSTKFFAKDGTEYQFGIRVNTEEYFSGEENSQEEEETFGDTPSGGLLNTVA